MITLAAAVFLASLLGSTHCAGMCGAFLAFAVTGDAPPRWLHVAYNLGRLATYLALGCLAGATGAALDLGAGVLGLQRVASVAAGAIMIGFGLVALLRSAGVRIGRFPVPGFMQRIALAGHRGAADLPPVLRALAVGLLTTLLPCGWLYAFVITAAGTASPFLGAGAMAAFWLGTLPVMMAMGAVMSGAWTPLRRHLPLLTALLMTGAGLFTLGQRISHIRPSASGSNAAPMVSLTRAGASIGPSADPALCHGR